MVKAFELRTQTKAQLAEQLKDLKHELLTLRTQKVKEANKPQLAKIGSVRKNIARVLTVMSQTQRDNLRVLYKGKKYMPLDLRSKKTRAIRRQLSKGEAMKKTVKSVKKDMHFPQRKYAVKAL